ncbi:MAG: ABC transporter permease [Eubacterium sp.]|nr:ABC transporter permease [Eubacterium sp.]
MNQFRTIFHFEIRNYFKNKLFVGTTIGIMIFLAIVMFFPRIKSSLNTTDNGKSAQTATDNGNEDRKTMLIASDDPSLARSAEAAFTQAFPDYQLQVTDKGENEIRRQIKDGTAEAGFLLHSDTDYTYFVKNISLYDSNTATADAVLRTIAQTNALTDSGLSPAQAGSIISVTVTHNVEKTGKDQTKNFFYTYIMIFALYMVILLYGQMVSTSVATEKSSRAMELLITSADPVSMMFGKVLAACLAGLIQLSCIFGTAFLLFQITRGDWEENTVMMSVFDMPLYLLLYMLLFFILGFLIYAFLYGAVGSTVSRLEDINTAIMPITFLFVIAFIVVVTAMSRGNVDTTPVIVCSFIPFTSPMAMFTRIAMSTVPIYQIMISVAILVVSVAGVGVLAARIYRVGVLLYGNAPKPREILRMIRKH